MDTRAQQAEQHQQDLDRAQTTTARLEQQIAHTREETLARLTESDQNFNLRLIDSDKNLSLRLIDSDKNLSLRLADLGRGLNEIGRAHV